MLYILGVNGENLIHKIGISSNTKQRIKQLDSIFAKHELKYELKTRLGRRIEYDIEQIIHKRLEKFRIEGSEYFLCSFGFAKQAVDAVYLKYVSCGDIIETRSLIGVLNTRDDISEKKRYILTLYRKNKFLDLELKKRENLQNLQD